MTSEASDPPEPAKKSPESQLIQGQTQYKVQRTPWWKQLLECLALTAAIVYAVVSFFMWRDINHNFKVDERAWVAPIAISEPPQIGKPFDVEIRLRNTGKTFAKELGTVDIAEPLTSGQEPSFSDETTRTPTSVTILAPNGDFLSTMHLTLSNDQKVLNKTQFEELTRKIQAGTLRVVVHGRVTYKDIFGQSHWTTFCFNLDPNMKYISCETHNDAD